MTVSRRSGSSLGAGTSYGMRASWILRFARTSRCAIVGGGTRKARAISSVDSPQSVRSDKATCASGASAGWQQVKIRRRRSSGTAASDWLNRSGSWVSGVMWPSSPRICSHRPARRRTSIALWRAVEMIHARGLAGRPSRSHCSSATANASWTASSATWKSPTRRMTVARCARTHSDRSLQSPSGPSFHPLEAILTGRTARQSVGFDGVHLVSRRVASVR